MASQVTVPMMTSQVMVPMMTMVRIQGRPDGPRTPWEKTDRLVRSWSAHGLAWRPKPQSLVETAHAPIRVPSVALSFPSHPAAEGATPKLARLPVATDEPLSSAVIARVFVATPARAPWSVVHHELVVTR